jgi:acetyl esterase/lipase
MRLLRWGIAAFGLPMMAALAFAQGAPDAALRLTPSLDPIPQFAEPQQSAPPSVAAPSPQPPSFGPQRITYPGGVTATFDLVYANLRGYRPLTLDLYQPAPRGLPMPLVVFVHGGG